MTPAGVSMSAAVIAAKFDLGAGGIDLSYLSGLATISLSAGGIALKYGPSSIELGPAGITIKGVLVTTEASGINTVKGSLVKLN